MNIVFGSGGSLEPTLSVRPSAVGNAFLNRLYTATLTHSDQSHGISQSLIVNEASYLNDIADVTSVSDDRGPSGCPKKSSHVGLLEGK